jgi:hypothetical protein
MCNCDRLDCLECGFRHCERLQRLPFARSGWASPPPEIKLEPVDFDDLPCGEDSDLIHTLDHAPDIASTSTSTSAPGSDFRPDRSSPPLSPQSLTGDAAEDPAFIFQDDETLHQPRLYQRTAIKAVNDAFEDGISRVGVSAPTGSGKTFIFAHVVREVLERNANGKVMILVDMEFRDISGLAGLVRVGDRLVTPGNRLICAPGATPEVLDELALQEIEQLSETERFNKQILQYYQAQAKGRRSTLIFSKSVQHANNLVTMMEEAGIRAKAVIHNTTAAARQDVTALCESGDCPVLITCLALSEGYDAPHVSSITSTHHALSLIPTG